MQNNRRDLLLGLSGIVATMAVAKSALANVPSPHDSSADLPMDTRANYIAWMIKNRGEDEGFLGQRWDRFKNFSPTRISGTSAICTLTS